MIMKMAGQRIAFGTDQGGAVEVFVDRVFCVQQIFDRFDWEGDRDPVLGRTVLQLSKVDATTFKPVVDCSRGVIGRLDELVHFFSGQMLPVTRVRGVGDCVTNDLDS
jgi:hypothetical protein